MRIYKLAKYTLLIGFFVAFAFDHFGGHLLATGFTLKSNSSLSESQFYKYDEDVANLTGNPCTTGAIGGATNAIERIVSPSPNNSITTCDLLTLDNQVTTAARNAPPGEQLSFTLPKGSQSLNGALLAITDGLLQQRTASGVVFAFDQVDKLRSAGSVNAQAEDTSDSPYFPGSGFQILSPIAGFWGWALTVSYSFMIVIILIIAFALLFQARLDGKQVVTIKNAIPNVVLAMILIPLSYPLTGLFIDGITLGTNVVHDAMFGTAGFARNLYENGAVGCGTSGGQECDISTGRGLYADDPRLFFLDARGLFRADFSKVKVFTCTASQTGEACSEAFKDQAFQDNPGLFIADSLTSIGSPENQLSNLVGTAINIVFGIVTIYVVIKMAWHLLKKFLILIISPIYSPFVCAMLAIPGSGTKYVSDYFKSLGAATLSYIAAYTMLLLTLVFTHPGSASTLFSATPLGGGAAAYIPPILFPTGTTANNPNNEENSPVVGPNFEIFFLLLGVGIFLSIPTVLGEIDKRLGTDKFSLPGFLGAPVKEFNNAYKAAVLPAAATARYAANNAASGVRGGIRAFANRRGDKPFDPTLGAKAGNIFTNAAQGARDNAAKSTNFITRAGYGAFASATESLGNATMEQLTGNKNAISKGATAGEGFEFSLTFETVVGTEKLENNTITLDLYELGATFTRKTGVRGSKISSDFEISGLGKIETKLVVKKGDKSGEFPGPATINRLDIKGLNSTPKILLSLSDSETKAAKVGDSKVDFKIEIDLSVLNGQKLSDFENKRFESDDINVYVAGSKPDTKKVKLSIGFRKVSASNLNG